MAFTVTLNTSTAFNVTLTSATGQVKVYTASSWTAKPVKVWNGTAWVIKPAKTWNGTAWVLTKY